MTSKEIESDVESELEEFVEKEKKNADDVVVVEESPAAATSAPPTIKPKGKGKRGPGGGEPKNNWRLKDRVIKRNS